MSPLFVPRSGASTLPSLQNTQHFHHQVAHRSHAIESQSYSWNVHGYLIGVSSSTLTPKPGMLFDECVHSLIHYFASLLELRHVVHQWLTQDLENDRKVSTVFQ